MGCALRCAFCATGKGGFSRNLKAHEIVDQVCIIKTLGFNIRCLVWLVLSTHHPITVFRILDFFFQGTWGKSNLCKFL